MGVASRKTIAFTGQLLCCTSTGDDGPRRVSQAPIFVLPAQPRRPAYHKPGPLTINLAMSDTSRPPRRSCHEPRANETWADAVALNEGERPGFFGDGLAPPKRRR